jgi:hypothetical protein
MDDNKIISFEDYRKRKAGTSYKEDALSSIFKKDLREQTDLLNWYLFHRDINKYKLFVHCLFYKNHRIQNPNPNSGYVIAYREDQIEERTSALIEAIKWEERDYILVPAAGRTYRQLGHLLREYQPQTNQEVHEFFKEDLLQSDKVIIIQELSRSRISGRKTDHARSLVKILDDAHFDGIYPSADLIFVDYTDFLHQSWSSIGTYLDVLA